METFEDDVLLVTEVSWLGVLSLPLPADINRFFVTRYGCSALVSLEVVTLIEQITSLLNTTTREQHNIQPYQRTRIMTTSTMGQAPPALPLPN